MAMPAATRRCMLPGTTTSPPCKPSPGSSRSSRQRGQSCRTVSVLPPSSPGCQAAR
uniref:Alternative protein ZNF598 n=1 Tax=Homo sapiens TaxID=9606 RepID=L8E9B0_HUMAN|nr:alternative protein ZNF598 [Homo sapiens]